MSIDWVFDPAPPSGSRTGGSSAKYCFEGKIDTLVREVIQNSKDANQGTGPVEVSFRLIDLDGGCLASFKDSLKWDSLVDNLKAAPDSRGGSSIKAGLDRLGRKEKLRLLVIEDRQTKGLEGDETRINEDEPNPFCALVKDELYSDKSDDGSGGSFGLGKSMLWAHSVFNTVLFSSVPGTPPSGAKGTRFMGSVILPWHSTSQDGDCSGRGWLGTKSGSGASRRALSKWFLEPEQTLESLFCERSSDSGLTAVIVGFEEPGGDPSQDAQEIIGRIKDSAIESFWPVLVRRQLKVRVSHQENGNILEDFDVDPMDDAQFSMPCNILTEYDAGGIKDVASLEQPGDRALKMAKLTIPECTQPGHEHPKFDCEVPVLVELLGNGASGPKILNMVQRFRSPGMIVRGEQRANLAFDARPFTALVLGGTASIDTKDNRRVERFLRAAEPPAHDKWRHDTIAIKQHYVSRGVKKMLVDFEDSVKSVIRNLIVPPRASGGTLPKSLLKHLSFGGDGGSDIKGFLSVTHTSLKPAGNHWEFSFKCRRVEPDDQKWKVNVGFKVLSDGGGGQKVDGVAITTKPMGCVLEGSSTVVFPGTRSDGVIRGTINPPSGIGSMMRSRVSLQIDGGVV